MDISAAEHAMLLKVVGYASGSAVLRGDRGEHELAVEAGALLSNRDPRWTPFDLSRHD